jgi:hypothetical protein
MDILALQIKRPAKGEGFLFTPTGRTVTLCEAVLVNKKSELK